MPDYDDLLARVELALMGAKRVERESRLIKTTLARLRDELQISQSKEDTENARQASSSTS